MNWLLDHNWWIAVASIVCVVGAVLFRTEHPLTRKDGLMFGIASLIPFVNLLILLCVLPGVCTLSYQKVRKALK